MTNYPFLQVHLVILLTGKYNLLELTNKDGEAVWMYGYIPHLLLFI